MPHVARSMHLPNEMRDSPVYDPVDDCAAVLPADRDLHNRDHFHLHLHEIKVKSRKHARKIQYGAVARTSQMVF